MLQRSTAQFHEKYSLSHRMKSQVVKIYAQNPPVTKYKTMHCEIIATK